MADYGPGPGSGTQQVAGTVAVSSIAGTVNTQPGGLAVFTSLNAVSAAGPGAALDAGSVRSNATLQVNSSSTTAPVTQTVVLQGSLDGTGWATIGTQLTGTAAGTQSTSVYGSPFRYYRANVTALTGGTGVAITALLGIAN